MASIGVLLVNLGTPDSPHPKDVYRYLIEFLTDKRVVDFPWWKRQLLVRGIIVPIRYRQSSRSYKEIWTPEGSPLLVHSRNVQKKLQASMGQDYCIELAMRYQNPSIKSALQKLLRNGVKTIIVLPLFPQYASATTGSVHEKVMKELSALEFIPETILLNAFTLHPAFIHAFAEQGRKYDLNDYDHILFSFHGLPERQLRKADLSNHCLKKQNCCHNYTSTNRNCYSAQSYATAQAIAAELNLPPERYTICFQSRLGRDPWLKPYASEVIDDLAHKGCKKLLAFCPSFVCDCLETTFEFGVEYAREFEEAGGGQLDLVEGLNASDAWIEALQAIITGTKERAEVKSSCTIA